MVEDNADQPAQPYIDTVTTSLEMNSPDRHQPVPEPTRVRVQVCELSDPTRADYLALYRGVGERYHWVDRIRMPEPELQTILADPAVNVFRFEVHGEAAGFAELDSRVPGEVELAYFGIFPQFQGQGLGKYFLSWIVQRAWEEKPQRVWVHTCDLDHPAALPNYQKAGFTIFDTKIVRQPIDA